MSNSKEQRLQMTFMPNTIEHLGARLYSTIPPVIAELIANSYDADASNVYVDLFDESEKKIIVRDDGHGMSFDDINANFLKIGRNRRESTSSQRSPGGRLVVGKKGLGKLSFFGIAHTIQVSTVKDGLRNTFLLKWSDIISDDSESQISNYEPIIVDYNVSVQDATNGTIITLSDIQRLSDFDEAALADSLSKLFIIDANFSIYVSHNNGSRMLITNERRYSALNADIEWDVPGDITFESDYSRVNELNGHLIATKTPISPSTNMRGITLFSRKKLVNLPEYFSDSTSSHFFSYLTGWIEVDFIDDLDEDVIETNRQSLDWNHPQIAQLRSYLQKMIRWLERDWRAKRLASQTAKLAEKTSISIDDWNQSLPKDISENLSGLVEALRKDSERPEKEEQAIKGLASLYKLIPPYPYFQWRHLNPVLQSTVFNYYKDQNYYHAVFEGVKKYVSDVKTKSSSGLTDRVLLENVFSLTAPKLSVTDKFKRPDGTSFDSLTNRNINEGHRMLVLAMWQAFRDPISHEIVDELRDSGLYTEQDCLDALSLLSHLFNRLDNSI